MIIAETLKALDTAFKRWYNKLAAFMVKHLPLREGVTVLEVGCGRGGLTIPLMEHIHERCQIIAFDLFSGPYKGGREKLQESITDEGYQDRVRILQGDVRKMQEIEDASIDVLISNDLFCDLDRAGLKEALLEFHRILKQGSFMAHGEFSPYPQNKHQKLMIEADMHSLVTMEPRPNWFSPSADEVAGLLCNTGFCDVVVKYFKTGIQVKGPVAITTLQRWNIDSQFIANHKEQLLKNGFEFPMEHIFFCSKP